MREGFLRSNKISVSSISFQSPCPAWAVFNIRRHGRHKTVRVRVRRRAVPSGATGTRAVALHYQFFYRHQRGLAGLHVSYARAKTQRSLFRQRHLFPAGVRSAGHHDADRHRWPIHTVITLRAFVVLQLSRLHCPRQARRGHVTFIPFPTVPSLVLSQWRRGTTCPVPYLKEHRPLEPLKNHSVSYNVRLDFNGVKCFQSLRPSPDSNLNTLLHVPRGNRDAEFALVTLSHHSLGFECVSVEMNIGRSRHTTRAVKSVVPTQRSNVKTIS